MTSALVLIFSKRFSLYALRVTFPRPGPRHTGQPFVGGAERLRTQAVIRTAPAGEAGDFVAGEAEVADDEVVAREARVQVSSSSQPSCCRRSARVLPMMAVILLPKLEGGRRLPTRDERGEHGDGHGHGHSPACFGHAVILHLIWSAWESKTPYPPCQPASSP